MLCSGNQLGEERPRQRKEKACGADVGVGTERLAVLLVEVEFVDGCGEVGDEGTEPLAVLERDGIKLWITSAGVGQPEPIKWNFAKFLIGRNGAVIRRYAPQVEPSALVADIEAALA